MSDTIGMGASDLLVHICEVCGTEKTMTSDKAFDDGWDYPPRMGTFGVLSARTCGNCPIDRTLWWRLAVDKVDPSSLIAADLALVERVQNEPQSLVPASGASDA